MAKTQPNVGARMRTIRQARRYSLKTLAERSGLSINSISLIERGQNSPTVSSLHRIAEALDVSITEFFDDPSEQATIIVRQDQRLRSESRGLEMESLGIGLRHQQIEPFFVTLTADGIYSAQPVVHPGQEFVYCLSGSLKYEIGENEHILEAGDSMLFDAGQPHRFSNGGTATTSFLLIFQTPEGGHIGRRKHLAEPRQA